MRAHEWKRELLTQRIRDLNGVPFTLKGNSYCNYGAPNDDVEDMIKDAIRHIEADELEQCERCCEDAELAQIEGIKELCGG
jgi:hypothetical protein